MSNKILMPSGGQTTDEMVILKWYKNVGDPIKRGDILFEIETDKAILTVESFAAGTLLEIKYPEGVMVRTGEVVAVIGNPNEIEAPAKISPTPNKEVAVATVPQAAQLVVSTPEKIVSQQNGEKILASPLAKSFAKKQNIRLEDVAGSVSKNLLRKKDIDNYIKTLPSIKQVNVDTGSVRRVSTSSMRKTIARRMTESVATSPHYIVGAEINMTGAIKLREKLNKNNSPAGSKISYNDIIMKVIAKAIESYPLINASYEGDSIRMNDDVNFGLAIAVEAGILVPVVRQVNQKSISEIAIANSTNIEKIKTNNFRESDITGGTITLSNLGMFGVDYFTAIINQPESCIVAVGGIIKKVIVENDEMVIRSMMNITASFDHRTIDGAVGAAFLMKVKSILEDPELLLF